MSSPAVKNRAVLSPWRRSEERPLVLGHRGASAHFLENTMEAFSASQQSGADGFELDIHMCGSGELVVFHDYDLRRMCADPRRIEDMSWRELSESKYCGPQIPLLAEVLHAFPGQLVNIELKPQTWRRTGPMVRALATLLKTFEDPSRFLVSSFDPRAIGICRMLMPQVARGLLFHRGLSLALRRGWAAHPLGASALHPHHELIDDVRMGRWSSMGFAVNTWTVDDLARAAHLNRIGVNAIICNDPAAVLHSLATDSSQ